MQTGTGSQWHTSAVSTAMLGLDHVFGCWMNQVHIIYDAKRASEVKGRLFLVDLQSREQVVDPAMPRWS
jgi:hypothetical protein